MDFATAPAYLDAGPFFSFSHLVRFSHLAGDIYKWLPSHGT